MRIFSPSVEAWRSYIDRYRGTIPADFLLAWESKESGGNPCSYTSLGESGIFQIHPDESKYVTNFAGLRTACSGSKKTRNLTEDEKALQVTTGVELVNHYRDSVRAQLANVGAEWSESSPDFWKLVKLGHALPAVSKESLPWMTKQFGPPSNWLDFVKGAMAMPPSAMGNGLRTFYYAASHAGRVNRIADVIANADNVGGAVDDSFSLESITAPGTPGWLAGLLGLGIAAGLWFGAKHYVRKHGRTLPA